MADLFEREQAFIKEMKQYVSELDGVPDDYVKKMSSVVKEYDRLLRQLRRVTKLTDKTTDKLNSDRLVLLDKVHIDPLTNVYNRRYLESSLEAIMKSLTLTDGHLAILMLDIDYFKKYNDTYGHGMGDKCLVKVANAIKSSIERPGDFVARYGGEEFTIVLPNTNLRGGVTIAKKIMQNLANLHITHEASEICQYVTASIGITSSAIDEETTSKDIFLLADKALYKAKADGRNRFAISDIEE